MSKTIKCNSVDFWHDVIVAHLLQGACSRAPIDFHCEISIIRAPDVQFARIRGVSHRFERTEKHVRNSRQTDFALILQLKGSAIQIQDGREVFLHPGELTCADATRPLQLDLNGEFEHLVLHMPRDIVVGAFGPTERFTALELSKRTAIAPLLVSFLLNVETVLDKVSMQTAARLSQTAIALTMSTLAEQSSMKLDHASWSQNALLYRAEEFIRQHSRNPDLTSQMVAEALNISIRYLQEVFRTVDHTPSEYIWQCRLQNSRQDLYNTCLSSLTIGDIAVRCGFSDFGHFGRRFKAAYGMSPREFRSKASNALGSAVGYQLFEECLR